MIRSFGIAPLLGVYVFTISNSYIGLGARCLDESLTGLGKSKIHDYLLGAQKTN